jgi:uncharacterized protein
MPPIARASAASRTLVPDRPARVGLTLWRVVIVALLYSASGIPVWAAIPADELLQSLRPSADVNDFAGLLTPAERESLEQRCRELREQSGAQLSIVLLDSLRGGEIDDFAVKLFERWGVGQAGKDNGVMLLVALQERQARIEVGYGLEPILTDALAGRILDQHLFPAFRRQQYAAGLRAAVDQIVEIIVRNEPAPAVLPPPPMRGSETLCFLLFLIPFSAFPAFLLGLGVRQKQLGMIFLGLVFLGFTLFFTVLARFPWWGYLVLLPFDTAAALFGYRARLLAMPSVRGRRSTPVSWTWGGSSWGGGSSWSGGGFSGGSWGGFGGGRSGGGGASGGW